MQYPYIKNLPEKKLVGKRITTTLAENKAFELWSSFMPRVKEIGNRSGTELYSVELYGAELNFQLFTADTPFEKWAAVEVADFSGLPPQLEMLIIPTGKYAVFLHKGLPADFPQTAAYIFGTWLPSSTYQLDQRPHFAVMGAKYRNNDPESEEEIWVPIRDKE